MVEPDPMTFYCWSSGTLMQERAWCGTANSLLMFAGGLRVDNVCDIISAGQVEDW